ncbi:MAG: hypothetical protein Phog2KO_48300 [Phototrophicaceae bacterium]
MQTQPNYDKLLEPIADVTMTLESLLNDAFGKLMGDQREGLKRIYTSAWGLHTLLLDIVTNIGIDNIAKRDYLPQKFDDYVNPLIDISQNLLNGLDGPLNEEQIVAVDYIRITGALLRHYVDNLWLYSLLDNNLYHLNKQATSFTTLLDPMNWSVSDEPVALELFIQDNLPDVIVDSDLMQSAISQIVENAINNTSEGSIRISIALDDTVQITVQDTGTGIQKRYEKDILKPFFQVNPEQLGLGLGLSITDKILKLHKGQLHISSLVQGTKVVIEFPITFS